MHLPKKLDNLLHGHSNPVDIDLIPNSVEIRQRFIEDKLLKERHGPEFTEYARLKDYNPAIFKMFRDLSIKHLVPNTTKIHSKQVDIMDFVPIFSDALLPSIDEYFEGYTHSLMNRFDQAEIFENIAYGSSSVAAYFVGNGLFTIALSLYGSWDQQTKFCGDLAKNSIVGCFALTGDAGGSNPLGLKSVTYTKKDGKYVLNGKKVFVTNGPIADHAIVFAEEKDADITAFIVPANNGFTSGKSNDMMGWRGSKNSEIFLDNVVLSEENILDSEHKGYELAMHVLYHMRINVAAQALGLMERAYDETLAFTKLKSSGNKKLAEIPQVREKLKAIEESINSVREKMYTETLGPRFDRQMRYRHNVELKFRQATVARSSDIKAYATNELTKVANIAMDLQGAWGRCEENPISTIHSDTPIYRIIAGSNDLLISQGKKGSQLMGEYLNSNGYIVKTS